jgi:hypothetical protein
LETGMSTISRILIEHSCLKCGTGLIVIDVVIGSTFHIES